jgi:hypothetical protein
MSPVRSQPSMNVAAVASGFCQYPFTTMGPFTHSSPTSFGGSSRFPSALMIFISATAAGGPQDEGRLT